MVSGRMLHWLRKRVGTDESMVIVFIQVINFFKQGEAACGKWGGAPQHNLMICFDDRWKTFDQSVGLCADHMKSVLASPSTADKADLLKHIPTGVMDITAARHIFIGLRKSHGTFNWQSNEQFSFTNWRFTAVDLSLDDRCAYINSDNAKWDFKPCNDKSSFICQKDAFCNAQNLKCYALAEDTGDHNHICNKYFKRAAVFPDVNLYMDIVEKTGIITENVSLVSQPVWLGLKKESDKKWKWLTGEELTYDTKWAPNNPVNEDSKKCVYLRPDDMKWYNERCNHDYQSICETDPALTIGLTGISVTSSMSTSTTPSTTSTTPSTSTSTSTSPPTTTSTSTSTIPPTTTSTNTSTIPPTTTSTSTSTIPPTTTSTSTSTIPPTTTSTSTSTIPPSTTSTSTSTTTTSFTSTKATCPTLSTTRAGTRITKSYSSGITMVTIQCDVNFRFPDGTSVRTVFCRPNGQWTSEIPKCQAIRCTYIPSPKNAVNLTFAEATSPVDTSVTYKCINQMRMRDGSVKKTLTCTSTGQWSADISPCFARQCPPFPYILNANINSTRTREGTLVHVRCTEGHWFGRGVYLREASCSDSLQWEPSDIGFCSTIMCRQVKDVPNADVNSRQRTFGSLIEYVCRPGYHFPDGSTRMTMVCLRHGTWNDSATPCTIAHCPALARGVNVERQADLPTRTFGASVTYTCRSSFRFMDGHTTKTIHCTETGAWSDEDVDCQSNRCKPVPEVENALASTTNATWYTNVTYTCKPGHRFPDGGQTKHAVCQNTGTWDSLQSACKAIHCTTPDDVSNATMEFSALSYGSFANYTCRSGHLFPNNLTFSQTTCQETGDHRSFKWLPSISGCQPVSCPPLRSIDNASKNADTTHYDARVTYTCSEGMEFSGRGRHVTLGCTVNATWDQNITECVVIQCPLLPLWADSVFNSSTHIYKTAVNYQCNAGFKFDDKSNVSSKTSVCTSDKTWDPPIVQCTEAESITADLKGKTWEAKEGRLIGAVVIGALAAAAVVVILLDASKMAGDLRMMAANVKDLIRVLCAPQPPSTTHKDKRI